MKLFVAILGSLLLLAVAAFCVFGFLATFEPTDSREFLHGNVKFSYDHNRVVYRCTECVHEQEQEEHFAPKR